MLARLSLLFSASFLLLGWGLFGAEPTVSPNPAWNDYSSWFATFMNKLADCSPMPTAQEKEDLNNLLTFKPGNTGASYSFWFTKAFCPFLEDVGSSFDNGEIVKMDFVVAAIPEVTDAGDGYSIFLDFAVPRLEGFLPSIDPSESRLMDYLKKIVPNPREGDYEKWLGEYDRLQKEFGPVYSTPEKTILKFLTEIRPTSSNNEGQWFRVKAETLMKIRNQINTQQYQSATALIDDILSGKPR